MKSMVRFADKPSNIFENINNFEEGTSCLSDNSNVDVTIDNIDRKNFAGVTPHAVKIEANKNVNLLKQSLIVPEYPMSQSFDSSVNQDHLQSYLGFTDSPSPSVNLTTNNSYVCLDVNEFQARLATNSMWNSVGISQEDTNKLTPTAANKIIEPFPDFSVKHMIQPYDENSNPNVTKPKSIEKPKTPLAPLSDKSISFSAKSIKNGLKSPFKSPRRKSTNTVNEIQIFNDNPPVATTTTNVSAIQAISYDIIIDNVSPNILTTTSSEKNVSIVASNSMVSTNQRHALLPCNESPIVKTPVEHNEAMSFHSSPAIPPFSVSESAKSSNNSENIVSLNSLSSDKSYRSTSNSISPQEARGLANTSSEVVQSSSVLYENRSYLSNQQSNTKSLTDMATSPPSFIFSSNDENMKPSTIEAPRIVRILSSYDDVYSQELKGIAATNNDVSDNSITCPTITSSVKKLGRQGGVALGKGPRIITNNKQYASTIVVNPQNQSNVTETNNSEISKQAKRVIVSRCQNSPGSVISKVPERSEATKVDRKKLAFTMKSKGSNSKQDIPISSSTATLLAQSRQQYQQSSIRESSIVREHQHIKKKTNHSAKVSNVDKNEVGSIVSSEQSVCSANSIDSCLTSEEQVLNKSDKHNVSIQCNSFLLSTESNAQHKAILPKTKTTSVAIATNTSTCDISYDYSAISSDLSQKVTPQMNNGVYKYHSPMFHSYNKQRHDSDSEDNIEHGLQEYLNASTTSSIAPLHSFDDTASGWKGQGIDQHQYGIAVVKHAHVEAQPWNHSFCEDNNKPWAAVSSNKSRSNSFRSISAPKSTQSGSRNSSYGTRTSSVLGSAQRVCSLTNDRLVSSSISKHSSHARIQSNSFMNESPVSLKSFKQFDKTVLTDAVVIPNDFSQLVSDYSTSQAAAALDYSMNSVDITKAETTLTLDHRHPLDISLSPEAHALYRNSNKAAIECGPRLAVLPLKREKGAVEDIKEINFYCIPGEKTTIALTISNHRNKVIRMNAHAVSLRFEELTGCKSIDHKSSSTSMNSSLDDHSEDKDSMTVESSTVPMSSFEVYPKEINILPGTEGLFYVSFNPIKLLSGVYSGAIKIRSHRKSFVLLLRGEAYYKEQQENVKANIINSIEKDNNKLLERIQKLKNKNQPTVTNVDIRQHDNPIKSTEMIDMSVKADSKSQEIRINPSEILSLSPKDTLLLQKSIHTCNRYEAFLNTSLLINNDMTSMELNMKSSVSFLKLAKSQIILSSKNCKDSVKVILDETASPLLDLCNKILSCDPSTASTILIGFIAIKTSMNCEYVIDVNLTRSACFLIQQQHMLTIKPNNEKKISFSVNKYSNINTPISNSNQSVQDTAISASTASVTNHQSIATNLNNTQLTLTDQSYKKNEKLNTTTITEKHQKLFFAPAKDDTIDFINKDLSYIYPTNDDELLELMNDIGKTTNSNQIFLHNPSIKSSTTPVSTMNKNDNDEEDDVNKSRLSIFSKNTESAASLLLNFARSHDPEPTISSSSSVKKVDVITKIMEQPQPQVMKSPSSAIPSMIAHPIIQQVDHKPEPFITSTTCNNMGNNSLMLKKTGVFFRKDSINFGSMMIGSLTRANLELCNSTNDEVIVYLGDPKLPFVLLHNEVTLRAKSYVRIPVRYLPVNQGEYINELIAQTEDGNHHTKIILMGNAY